MSLYKSKIISSIDDINKLKEKSNIVFTNGCFDILHPGHLNYLSNARKLGDFLVVGLNTDSSIKLIKGNSRPINDFKFRSTMLSHFNFIDYIIPFDEKTPLSLIKKINPSILVKGNDYDISAIVGSSHVINNGGKVKTLKFLHGYSTSEIIKKIKLINE